ncbi:tetratricopeptide repeat protein [bacterium]|nr:tetratricopeptide repeat protein [bacterium]
MALLATSVVFCFAAWWFLKNPPPTSGDLLDAARRALKQRDFQRALKIATSIPRESVDWKQSRLVAAEAAIRSEDQKTALTILSHVPRDDSSESVLAAFTQAELFRDSGRLTDALEACQYAASHSPDNAAVQERLAFLYGVTGQRWESLPALLRLARSGTCSLQELAILGDTERPLEYRDFLEGCQEKVPDDPLILTGLGAVAYSEGEPVLAREYLDKALSLNPSIVSAHALLGEMLVDSPNASFSDWSSRLPQGADENPHIWLVRGLWARKLGTLPVAARCFQEALVRQPEHRRANYQMGLTLHALGHPASAAFSDRAADLFELTGLLDAVLRSEGRNEPAVQHIVSLLEKNGRYWEAWAWCRRAGTRYSYSNWAQLSFKRITQLAADTAVRTAPDHNPAVGLDLSTYPTYLTLIDSPGGISSEAGMEPRASAH